MDPQEVRIRLCFWIQIPYSFSWFQIPGYQKWHSNKDSVFRRAEFCLFLSRELEVFPGAWKAFMEIVDKYLAGPDPEDQSLRIHPDPI